jgi:transcription antitermination protein NusB
VNVASPRRQGREVALQVLCILEANPGLDSKSALALYLSHLAGAEGDETPPGKESFDQRFAQELVDAAAGEREQIDRDISQVSRSWRLDRMARVDRNILRLAIAEMRYLPEIPARVTLNEAVELAKRYGSAESAAFVNGVLDSAVKALDIRK